MSWARIIGFRLVTRDLDRLTQFYERLGFAVGQRTPIAAKEMALLGLSGSGIRQHLTLGPSRLAIDMFDPPGREYPAGADAASLGFQHFALVTNDAARAWDRISTRDGSSISRPGPVALPASAGGVVAAKFRDPDGHPLELLQFPDGAAHGWRGQGLLGIDHSAVSVSDAAASQRWYEAHGLSRGKPSLNRGPTQDALDGLKAVEVDVVPMLPAASPPHLELLGYRHPRERTSAFLAPNDVAATRIVWQAETDALVRDPDGHLHQLQAS